MVARPHNVKTMKAMCSNLSKRWAVRLATLGMWACALLAVACDGSQGGDFNNAGGKPYELVVSVPQEAWVGEVGDTLRAVLLEPIPMFNQVEPLFDISRITPDALKDVILRHRNLLIVNISPDVKEATATAQYDVYARPQIIVTLSAPDNRSMVHYLSENRAELQQLFEITERNRAVANDLKYGEKGISKEIADQFGIRMNIPRGFTIRGCSEDFLWIGNDVRIATQGLVIYSYPFTGEQDFTLEELIRHRNEFVKRIPGPSDGSYMATEDYITPTVVYPKINGRQWAEMHGFWFVQNDFMGGPFVTYATFDPVQRRVLCVDCFVYSPKEPKRNLLRQLQHTVWSVEFTDEAK